MYNKYAGRQDNYWALEMWLDQVKVRKIRNIYWILNTRIKRLNILLIIFVLIIPWHDAIMDGLGK